METAFERGWSNLKNGALIDTAEANGFEVLVTTDKNLRYQQNLTRRRIAIGVLWTTSWPELAPHGPAIVAAVETLRPAECRDIERPA